MNKNSNTLFGSKQNNTVVKNIVEAEPALYGAAPSGSTAVRFAYHSGDAIANGEAGQIVFNKLAGTGAIVINGELVSSKILDVVAAQKLDASTGVKTVTVKYIGADNAILTSNFEVVDAAAVKAWIKALDDANDERLTALETYAKDTNITADAANAVKVVATDGDDNFKNYSVNLKIKEGEKVLSQSADGLASTLKLNLVAASEGTPAVLYTNADEAKAAGKHVGDVKTPAVPGSGAKLQILGIGDAVVTEMPADNFLIDGMLETAEIHKTVEDDGTQASFLHLVWNTAAGSKETEINLTDLIDIENVTSSNTTYLTSAIDGGKNITLTPIVKTAAETHYVGESGFDGDANVTAIPDAASFKKYIDEKSTNLAVSASGDTYVNAGVDARNNKHINVSANVDELTIGKVGEDDTTISGVSTTLVSGGEVASKVSTFVNNRIDEEIKKLDVSVTSDDAAVATVNVVETAGKISDVVVTTKAAEVATAGNKDARTLTATLETGAVLGSDLAVLKEFIENVASDASANAFASAKAALDSSITGLDASLDATDASHYIHVGVAQEDGKIKGLVLDASVINSSTDLAAVGAAGKLVDAKAVKDLIDAKVDAQDSEVTVSDEFITATIAMVDGALNQDQSSLSYQKAVYANDSNSVTTNGLVDGQLALDMINDRIADLDKEETTSKDTNEYVTIKLKVENGLASITSVAVKTHDVSTATADNDGLATAYGSRSYVDARLTWAVI